MIARGSSFSGRERNCAFLNTGTHRFADVSAAAGLDLIDDGRAVALTDWDQDGDLDLWLANRTAPRLRLVRNDLPSRGRALAVQLEGRNCNRDAIGARVEVYLEGDSPRRLVETVRAGDGFLTQSTKWLSFGLGAYDGPVRLRIRWPGESEWEEFGNLEGGQRYKIVQGSQAGTLVRANHQNALLPSPPRLAALSDQARVVLTRPVRLPRLEYVDFDQSPKSLPTDHTGPILLNLWASWCTPCLSELREFAENHQVLDDVGLAIVAVSTDALDRGGDPQAAQRFVEAAELPFRSGLANADLIRVLSSVHGRVFYKERAFPLPCSFLLDRDGQWAVIYRGGVKAEQLAKDVALLGAEQTVLDTQAFPATGHFVYRGPGISSLAIVEAYREGGYLKDAHQELLNLVARVREKPNPTGAAAKSLADVYGKLASIESGLGKPEEAEAAWREAVRLDADSAKPRVGLAIALESQGKASEAAEHLKSVLSAGANNPETLHLVGRAALQMGSTKQAVESLRKAMTLSPDSVAIQLDLAVALQLAGDVAGEPKNIIRSSAGNHPRHRRPTISLGCMRRTPGVKTVTVHEP